MTITEPKQKITLPWVVTPLLESEALSRAAGCKILMKMDLHQPSGSFKSRGVGNLCFQQMISNGADDLPVHFYASSAGNAGLAAATAARSMGADCTVVVPHNTTKWMVSRIRAAGGEIIQYGESLTEADEYLHSLMKKEAGNGIRGVYCPPYDHPDIWQGNATVVDEILSQMGGEPPAAIIASVGGGGLLIGIQMGLDKYGLSDVPIIAVETAGSNSLAYSLSLGENTTLPKVTSIATSLGARKVAQKCFDFALRKNVHSVVLSDGQAARACLKFLDDERVMVEAACGVSVACCYEGTIHEVLPHLRPEDKVVVIICGGSNVNFEILTGYRTKYGEASD